MPHEVFNCASPWREPIERPALSNRCSSSVNILCHGCVAFNDNHLNVFYIFVCCSPGSRFSILAGIRSARSRMRSAKCSAWLLCRCATISSLQFLQLLQSKSFTFNSFKKWNVRSVIDLESLFAIHNVFNPFLSKLEMLWMVLLLVQTSRPMLCEFRTTILFKFFAYLGRFWVSICCSFIAPGSHMFW